MPHDIVNGAIGHNGRGASLQSALPGPESREALQVLCDQFIDGWRNAADKAAYLRLAGVPFERRSEAGTASLKLVDVRLTCEWQVGTASPGFGTRELSYLPFPGDLVRERSNMAFVYVSSEAVETVDLRSFLASRCGEHL